MIELKDVDNLCDETLCFEYESIAVNEVELK